MLSPELLAEFKALWDSTVNVPDDEHSDEVRSRITQIQHLAGQHLTCCQDAKDSNALYWDGQRWGLRLSSEAFAWDRDILKLRIPAFCPYCGKALPKMVKIDLGVPVYDEETDQGYRCHQCHRGMGCICLPPGSDYKPEDT